MAEQFYIVMLPFTSRAGAEKCLELIRKIALYQCRIRKLTAAEFIDTYGEWEEKKDGNR